MPKPPLEGKSSGKVLVDTNVWIFFFRQNPEARFLTTLLTENRVITHPFVLGEMMLGTLGSRRGRILSDLSVLPKCPLLASEEIIHFTNHYKLYGKGLSLIDVHLLGSSKAQNIPLWTFDKKLHHEAKKLGCDFST